MNHHSNIVPLRAPMAKPQQTPVSELAAALERARPAIIAACAPVKGLRATRRAQVLQTLFASTSTVWT